jgi:hypothetical protein
MKKVKLVVLKEQMMRSVRDDILETSLDDEVTFRSGCNLKLVDVKSIDSFEWMMFAKNARLVIKKIDRDMSEKLKVQKERLSKEYQKLSVVPSVEKHIGQENHDFWMRLIEHVVKVVDLLDFPVCEKVDESFFLKFYCKELTCEDMRLFENEKSFKHINFVAEKNFIAVRTKI